MKNSEVAEKAIEVMERDGWRRGSYGHHGVPGCLVGTVRKVLAEDSLGMFSIHPHIAAGVVGPVVPVVRDIPEGFDPTYSGIVLDNTIAFNDQVVKNKAEATEVLTEAAKYWRNRGE